MGTAGLSAQASTGGTTTRESHSSAGVQADQDSWAPQLSADGRFVVFLSHAANLVPETVHAGTSHYGHIYLRDTQTGTTTLISKSSSGVPANAGSFPPDISADGSVVVFDSLATNLVGSDTNGHRDVFAHVVSTGETEMVSTAATGGAADNQSTSASVSADGRYVVFRSSSSDLVAPVHSGIGIYRRDRSSGTTVRVSVKPDGTPSSGNPTAPGISGDGNTVAFNASFGTAPNDLVPGAGSGTGVYARDLTLGQTERLDLAPDGTPPNGPANSSGDASSLSVSHDGAVVAFGSLATNLTGMPGTTGSTTHVFVRRRGVSAETVHISTRADGTAASTGGGLWPEVSGDGTTVAFISSAGDMVDGKTGSNRGVFVRAVSGGPIELASIRPNGEITNSEDSGSYGRIGVDGDGTRVVFESSDPGGILPDDNGRFADIWLRDRTGDSTPPPPTGENGRIYYSRGGTGALSVQPDGTDERNLGISDATYPTLSPDGSRLVLVKSIHTPGGSGTEASQEIYIANPDGTGLTRLTDNAAQDYKPAWSPDGSKIVFMSHRDGNYEIYTMNADGDEQYRLTDDAAVDQDPVWSPDGTRIAFMSGRNGDRHIYTVAADGSSLVNLMPMSSADNREPSWGPDGTILFASTRDNSNFDIYRMAANGTDVQRVTTDGGREPWWSPDGTKIVYRRPSSPFGMWVMNADGSGPVALGVSGNVPRWGTVVDEEPPGCTSDGHGDTTDTAGDLPLATPVDGTLCEQGEADYFRLAGRLDGDRIDGTVTYTGDAGDVAVALLDAAGTTIATGTGSATGDTMTVTLSHDVEVDGTYYLRVANAGSGSPAYTVEADVPPRISGTVTDSVTSEALQGVTVTFSSGGVTSSVTSDALGRYASGHLAPGSYLVHFADGPADAAAYDAQYYDGAQNPSAATTISLQPGDVRNDVDARMVPMGVITGTVSDHDGDPLAGAQVTAQTSQVVYKPSDSAQTDSSGRFRLVVSAGSYVVQATAGRTTIYYDGATTQVGATAVPVTAGTETSDIGFMFPPHELTVNKSGTGSGTVQSTPAGIACGTTCSADFAEGTQVTLTATASAGSVFQGWSSPCSGVAECVVTMDSATTVTAAFEAVSQSPLPDLVASAQSVPDRLHAGQRFTLPVRTVNQGSGQARSSTTRLYLSSTPQLAGDALAVGKVNVPFLRAGASNEVVVRVMVPPSAANGHYWLIACADDTDVVIESAESNNCEASENVAEVGSWPPDLVIDWANGPASRTARLGGRMEVSALVRNIGHQTAERSTVRWFLGSATEPLHAIGDKDVGKLTAGQSRTVKAGFRLPTQGISPGTYVVWGCAIAGGPEYDPSNNCAASKVSTQIPR